MKTTLNIDDSVMALLKREAARQGRTMSELVESALRLMFRTEKKRADVPPLPTFRSGGHLVDISRTGTPFSRPWRGGSVRGGHEYPRLCPSGNLMHDAHTAVLMREHGIKRVYTRDTDFHRFPFLEPVDPAA